MTITGYREIQHFRQLSLWLVVLGIAGIFWYGALAQLIFQKLWGAEPALDAALAIFWLVFGVGLPALFYFISLTTEVRDDGIYFQFFPFHLSFRRIGFEQIREYEARTYRPILEYGGWGIRYGSRGKAYNVRGNRGLQFELSNGEYLLIGSQRPQEFYLAIQAICRRERQDTDIPA